MVTHGGGGSWKLGGYKELDRVLVMFAEREEKFGLIQVCRGVLIGGEKGEEG